jgi:hypothetical protein
VLKAALGGGQLLSSGVTEEKENLGGLTVSTHGS